MRNIPISDDPDRQMKIGAFLIRESSFAEMEKGIHNGLHYVDAAEEADIPFEVALELLTDDSRPEFREWYLESKDRPMVERHASAGRLPVSLSPMDMKHGFLEMLWQAGLPHKAAQMVRLADISSPQGQSLVLNMLKVSKDFYPRETSVKNTEIDDTENKTLEELKKRLAELAEKKKASEAALEHGSSTLKRLTERSPVAED